MITTRHHFIAEHVTSANVAVCFALKTLALSPWPLLRLVSGDVVELGKIRVGANLSSYPDAQIVQLGRSLEHPHCRRAALAHNLATPTA